MSDYSTITDVDVKIPNNEIMLTVFEKFLENPKTISLEQIGANEIDEYLPQNLPNVELRILRWHVGVLLSEFVFDHRITSALNDIFCLQGTEYLNWRGQALYHKLKAAVKQQPEHE